MRVFGTILVGLLVGVLGGVAIAMMEIRSDPDAPDRLADTLIASSKGGDKNVPRIQVEQASYNFGTMQRGTTKSHEFVIRNVGTAPLTIRNGGTTCKCTLSQVAEESIAPGGKTTVKLEWTAKADNGPFQQTATILHNDLSQPKVDLQVHGEILAVSGVEPRDFLFDRLAVDEVKKAEVFVMAMLQDELTVDDPTISDPAIRDKFDIKIEPVEKDKLPNKLAKRGYRISITTKEGLPIGRFHSWLTIKTNLPEAEKLEIPIVGQVIGDISAGATSGWSEELGGLIMGTIKSSEGGHGKANLIVRGADADKVKFEVKSVDPAELKVTLGKPVHLKDTLVHVPVNIEIPVGTHPMVHLDTAQGEAGRIVFSTTHPKIKELSLPVRFAVER